MSRCGILALSLAVASALALPGGVAAVSPDPKTFAIAGAAPMEAISVGVLRAVDARGVRFEGAAELRFSNTSALELVARLRLTRKGARGRYTFRSVGGGLPRFSGVVRTAGEPDAVIAVRLVFTRGRRDKVKQRDARSTTVAPGLTTTTTTSVPGATTTTTTRGTTTTTLAQACPIDGGDGTVVDPCTGFQWEK